MNADNMDFRAGVMRDVPHSRGEKVVKLTAPPPVEWELLK